MKYKKIITVSLLASAVYLPAHAQEAPTVQPIPPVVVPTLIQNIKEAILGGSADSLEQKQEEMRRFREEKTKEIQTAVNETKDTLTDKKTEVGTFIETKVKNRIEETFKSFDNLDTRISSRIEKLKKSGADVKKAEQELQLARLSKADAELQYELLSWNTLDANTIKTNVEIIKAIREDVTNTHIHLTEAVKALKSAQINLEDATKTDTQ
jgi:AAA15 family ATPase/GTPase